MKVLRITFLFLLLVTSVSAYAQNDTDSKSLIPAAKKIAQAYAMLEKHPGDSLYQVQYLLDFPHNWKTFLEIYNPPDFSQLYDAIPEHFFVFETLSKKHPELVGIDLITLGKQANYPPLYNPDAIDVLRHTIATFAANHTSLFVKLFRQLSSIEKNRLTFLLADVENFKGYHEYKQIISNLESSGNTGIADRFKRAESERKKEGH